MKIKLDENLPERLGASLAALGHDVDSVRSEGIAGSDDDVVWRAAQSTSRFLIAQDLDFSDVRRYVPGTHAGLLLVRIAQPGREALLARVRDLFETEAVEGWHGCVVIATDYKVRIRRGS